MRLRIIDINCRWFWFTLFFWTDRSPKNAYHIESHLYEYQSWAAPWFYFWKWEPKPNPLPAVAKQTTGIGADDNREVDRVIFYRRLPDGTYQEMGQSVDIGQGIN